MSFRYDNDGYFCLTTHGLARVRVSDRRAGITVERHWAAVQRYLVCRQQNGFGRFDGVTISGLDDTGGSTIVTLATDRRLIDRWARRRTVDFEAMLAGHAAGVRPTSYPERPHE